MLIRVGLLCVDLFLVFFFSSRRRHTRCALVTGVQTCALPISLHRQLVIQPGAERLATRGDRLGRRRWRRVAAARAGRPVTAGVITVVVLAVVSRTADADRLLAIIFGVVDRDRNSVE